MWVCLILGAWRGISCAFHSHTVCRTHLTFLISFWLCSAQVSLDFFLIYIQNSEQFLFHWFHHFFPLLLRLLCLAFIHCVHLFTNVYESKCVWVQVCVCSWMTGQGLWTLRPGWRIEAPWKPLQPALTASRGWGARERRSKLKRQGQEVDMKQKIHRASTVQGSIYGLCRISKRVSAVKVEEELLWKTSSSGTGWRIALRGCARPNRALTVMAEMLRLKIMYHSWDGWRCLLNS